MEKGLMLDFIIILNTLILFFLQIYLNVTNRPFEVQALPAILLAVPVVITLYKKRLETEKIETQRIINRLKKLEPLMVKLARIRNIPNIAKSLTYNKQFLDDEIAFMGWRKYFERYGDQVINDDFGYLDNSLGYLINVMEKPKIKDLHETLAGFYLLVSDFRHLYDDFARMIQLVGKNPPKEELGYIEELEENYEDFFESLQDLCDEDEEIGEVFKGRYPLVKPNKKLTIT